MNVSSSLHHFIVRYHYQVGNERYSPFANTITALLHSRCFTLYWYTSILSFFLCDVFSLLLFSLWQKLERYNINNFWLSDSILSNIWLSDSYFVQHFTVRLAFCPIFDCQTRILYLSTRIFQPKICVLYCKVYTQNNSTFQYILFHNLNSH